MNGWNMSQQPRGSEQQEARLDSLFQAYRASCEPGEVSPNFMPELWQKIESVQNSTFSFRRIARGFVTAAGALSLVLATLIIMPAPQTSPVDTATYVETLAAHDGDAFDQVRPDSTLEEISEEL